MFVGTNTNLLMRTNLWLWEQKPMVVRTKKNSREKIYGWGKKS
jgi:hypothetical protein